MYSVVLMMSLTGGTEVPEFGRRSCCGCSGGYSCCGGCHGGRRARRCHGCCGGYSCCGGGAYGCCGGTAPMSRPPSGERVPPPKKTQAEDRGTIVVTLPAEARLTIGGRPTTSTSALRRFITPPLSADREAFYTMRAEILRDGQPVAIEQQVAVRPGQETRVSFDFAATAVASAP
jgi:uncharacterized protein (TIGR03000 family)